MIQETVFGKVCLYGTDSGWMHWQNLFTYRIERHIMSKITELSAVKKGKDQEHLYEPESDLENIWNGI